MVQTSLHAQISAANHHNLNSATMNGRASISGAASGHGLNRHGLGLPAGFTNGSQQHSNNLTSIHSSHHGANSSANNGISASNFHTSNHHQNHHHLGHNLHRNRHLSATAAAVAVSLNSHFTHSHFNSSNLSQNSHHHHHLSLSSNSSAMSSASSSSSSPSASISPSSLALASSPQSNLSGFHQASGAAGGPFHGGANHVIENSHHSSPQQQQQQQQPQQQNTSRYKTELCRPFEENGTCKYGEKCQFAHGMSELRTLTRHPKYKTEFCRTFHTTGFCPYGPRCHFIHNSKTPPTQAQLGLSSYAKLPFGHQTSHSASPSTSPISSTSSAATTNGSLSSSESTASSSSPPTTNRLLDVAGPGLPYRNIGSSSVGMNLVAPEDRAPIKPTAAPGLRRVDKEDISHSTGCVSDTQRLFWLHSHLNEGSRWPPAMCAGGLIESSNARRTWQMQA